MSQDAMMITDEVKVSSGPWKALSDLSGPGSIRTAPRPCCWQSPQESSAAPSLTAFSARTVALDRGSPTWQKPRGRRSRERAGPGRAGPPTHPVYARAPSRPLQGHVSLPFEVGSGRRQRSSSLSLGPALQRETQVLWARTCSGRWRRDGPWRHEELGAQEPGLGCRPPPDLEPWRGPGSRRWVLGPERWWSSVDERGAEKPLKSRGHEAWHRAVNGEGEGSVQDASAGVDGRWSQPPEQGTLEACCPGRTAAQRSSRGGDGGKDGESGQRHRVVGRRAWPVASNAVPKSRKMGTESDPRIQRRGRPDTDPHLPPCVRR